MPELRRDIKPIKPHTNLNENLVSKLSEACKTALENNSNMYNFFRAIAKREPNASEATNDAIIERVIKDVWAYPGWLEEILSHLDPLERQKLREHYNNVANNHYNLIESLRSEHTPTTNTSEQKTKENTTSENNEELPKGTFYANKQKPEVESRIKRIRTKGKQMFEKGKIVAKKGIAGAKRIYGNRETYIEGAKSKSKEALKKGKDVARKSADTAIRIKDKTVEKVREIKDSERTQDLKKSGKRFVDVRRSPVARAINWRGFVKSPKVSALRQSLRDYLTDLYKTQVEIKKIEKEIFDPIYREFMKSTADFNISRDKALESLLHSIEKKVYEVISENMILKNFNDKKLLRNQIRTGLKAINELRNINRLSFNMSKDIALHEGYYHKLDENYYLAIQQYGFALKLDPNNPEILSELGECYKDLGHYQEALDYYNRAAEFGTNDKILQAIGKLKRILESEK